MGNLESRFHHFLSDGDLEQASQFWSDNVDLQTKINLRTPVKYSNTKDPPLHCILRVGNYRQPFLKILMHQFLEKGADPLWTNGDNQTAIHVLCCSQRHSARENKSRREILEILLDKLPTVEDDVAITESNQFIPAKGSARNLSKHLNMGDKVQTHIQAFKVNHFYYFSQEIHLYILLQHQVYWNVLKYVYMYTHIINSGTPLKGHLLYK